MVQGGILSPKLFNIFYDTLINKIDNLGFFIIAYADDITIAVINNKDIKNTTKEVENWAKEYEMKFNKEKSVIIIHKKQGKYKNLD